MEHRGHPGSLVIIKSRQAAVRVHVIGPPGHHEEQETLCLGGPVPLEQKPLAAEGRGLNEKISSVLDLVEFVHGLRIVVDAKGELTAQEMSMAMVAGSIEAR